MSESDQRTPALLFSHRIDPEMALPAPLDPWRRPRTSTAVRAGDQHDPTTNEPATMTTRSVGALVQG